MPPNPRHNYRSLVLQYFARHSVRVVRRPASQRKIYRLNVDQQITLLRALHETLGSDVDGDYLPLLAQRTDADWRNPDNFLKILTNQPQSFADQRAQLVSAIRAEIGTFPTVDADELDRVLAQIGRVPREEFMPSAIRGFAYLPGSFAIGYDQTISNPHIVTVMTLAARLPPNAHVLDVGTGSGYQAAILCGLARSVVSVEIIPTLARAASERLRRLGYVNAHVVVGDGREGLLAEAPFDAIIVAAGAQAVPQALLDQLKPDGLLVIPIGQSSVTEQIMIVGEPNGEMRMSSLGLAKFVPLTGKVARQASRTYTAYDNVPFHYGLPVT